MFFNIMHVIKRVYYDGLNKKIGIFTFKFSVALLRGMYTVIGTP